MATYPFLVEVAWEVLAQLIGDWQENPYRWSKEIDVQAELATRLDKVYRLLSRGTARANYKNAIAGFKGKQFWSRVCCEPTVQCQWKGERVLCSPDVAVFDDIPDPNSPPDANEAGRFPLLWACEIKLDARSDAQSPEGWSDLAKMTTLLKEDRARYACLVAMFRRRAGSGTGIQWDRKEEKLWQCTAELPPLVPTS
jgi:hypothetical protein